MHFSSEQLLDSGIRLKFIVVCGVPPDDETFTTAEGLYLKRPQDEGYRIVVPMAPQYHNEKRRCDLMILRAQLLEPYLIEGVERIDLPFLITLRLRTETWLKAEPLLKRINKGGQTDEVI